LTVLELSGCTPEPIAAYLKGLGVLRLVSAQEDPGALGFWEEGCFHLESSLDESSLMAFFLERYEPTPIVAPWLGGSGFYDGDKRTGMDRILATKDRRFSEYRDTIRTIQSWPEMPMGNLSLREIVTDLEKEHAGELGAAHEGVMALINELKGLCAAVKPSSKGVELLDLTVEMVKSAQVPGGLSPPEASLWEARQRNLKRVAGKLLSRHKALSRADIKDSLVRLCRNRLGDRPVEWVDAAVVLDGEGDPHYPPLLGTGGNEGRLNYTSTFMDHVGESLCTGGLPASEALLRASLFGSTCQSLIRSPVGQLDPGRAGGYNQGNGVESKVQPANPWDFILSMEGVICWSSSITRRARAGAPSFLSSPFSVRASPVGYPSANDKDRGEARSEVWAPLWSQPAGYAEIKSFIGEGRAEVGTRTPRNGVEFAEAVASLGIDRGVHEFVRHSLLHRRGDSYVATALSRFRVQGRKESELLRGLDAAMAGVDSALFRDGTPARYLSARRNVDEAKFEVSLKGGKPAMKSLLAAVGRLERLLASKDPRKKPEVKRPPSGLGAEWVEACDDGTLEVRLAAALASIAPSGDVGPIRANLAPVDPSRPWQWATSGTQLSWAGTDVSDRLSATVARRIMDAQRLRCERPPFHGSLRVSAEDVSAFIDGDLDEGLFEDLLFGFCWVEWHKAVRSGNIERTRYQWAVPVTRKPVNRAWASMKPLFMPRVPSIDGSPIRVVPEPRVIPLLRAGRVGAAGEVARRRLFSNGFPVPNVRYPDDHSGRRIAGALLFPVSWGRWLGDALGTHGKRINRGRS
jgi:CRISPR-associated protein Csx17